MYIIKIENTTLYKIGVTSDLLNRINTLKTAIPFKIKLIAYRRTDKALNTETMLHNFYINNRTSGE